MKLLRGNEQVFHGLAAGDLLLAVHHPNGDGAGGRVPQKTVGHGMLGRAEGVGERLGMGGGGKL